MIIPKLSLNNNYNKNQHKSLVKSRNVILDKDFELLENESGFSKKHTFVNSICGVIPTPDRDVVLCTDNQSLSEIYVVTDDTKELVIQGDFGFSTSFPFTGEYQYNSLGDLIVVFNDTENPIWAINIDNIDSIVDIDNDRYISDNDQITKLKLNPQYIMPNVLMFDPISGNLPKGIYQIVVCYYIGDHDTLNWSLPSKTITIGNSVDYEFYYYSYYAESPYVANPFKDYTDSNEISFKDKCQKAGEEISNKGIRARVVNLDERYKKFKAALIYTTTTTTKVYEIGNFEIDTTDPTFTKDLYISNLPEKELSIDEVTIPNISYEKVNDICKFDNTLYMFGLHNNTLYDYQKYANNIQVKYEVQPYYKDDYSVREETDSETTDDPIFEDFGDIQLVDMTQNKTVMLDEVYSLAIGLIGKDGIIKGWYHIPGRAPKVGETDELVNSVIVPDPVTKYKYQAINTAANYDDEDRYLAFWQNENEEYPRTDDFEVWDVDMDGDGYKVGDIRGEKVRHHKTPSFNRVYDADGSKPNKLVGLSFKNIKFPKEIKDNIQGYVIGYIPRDSSNMTVLGHYPLVENDFYITTRSKPRAIDHYQDLSNRFRNPNYKLGYRFNDLNILSNKPSMNRPYIAGMYVSDNSSKYKVDCTKVDEILGWISPLNGYEYLPKDNNSTNPANTGREEALFLDGDIYYNAFYGDKCQTVALKDDKKDVYTNLANRRVAIASKIFYINDNQNEYTANNIFNFDCHLNDYYSILFRGNQTLTLDENTLTRYNGDFDDNNTTVITAFRVFGYSTMDAAYKEVSIKPTNYEWQTEVLFGTDKFYAINSNLRVDPSDDNIISYDNTYSRVNNIKATYIKDLTAVETSSFPYRVARSLPQSKEAITLNWRNIPAIEYYEQPKHRGKAVAIEAAGRKLLLHHEHSLYVASIKDRLKTDQGDAYIGVADIFEYPPEELLFSKGGKAGLQSRFGYTIGEDGYIFADIYEPAIYKYSNEGYAVLSDMYIRRFFDKYIIHNTAGNPLEGNDVLVMHDEKSDRIIVTNKGENPFTMSYCYNPKSQAWICFHDYIPALMYNNRRGTYAIDQDLKGIYKFHEGERGTYFNDIKYTSYIDVLLNDSPKTSKELNSISIQSGVIGEENNIDALFFYTKTQCSNVITIEEWNDLNDYDKIRYIENYWNYGFIRDYTSNYITQDIVDDFGNINQESIFTDKNWYELSPIVDKNFIVRLIVNNDKPVLFKDLVYNATVIVR